MKTFTAKYNASVKTPAGWRSVTMTAVMEKISDKRAAVSEVTEIDGDSITKYMSRTGAKRQQFDGKYFADCEVGKVKNLSSMNVVELAE